MTKRKIKETAFPVRLDPDQAAQLEVLAAKAGINKSELLRVAAGEILKRFANDPDGLSELNTQYRRRIMAQAALANSPKTTPAQKALEIAKAENVHDSKAPE